MIEKVDLIVLCEESQMVMKAFRAKGVNAKSCDLKPCSGGMPEHHLQMDAFEAIELYRPRMIIGHPPCTFISSAGLFWCHPKYGAKALARIAKRDEAVKFFMKMWNAPVEMICLENPAGYISSTLLKPDQRIDPYFFGDPHLKRTMLWLKNLPKLIHIKEDDLFYNRTHTHTHRNHYPSIPPVRNDITLITITGAKHVPKLSPALLKQWPNNGLYSYDRN